jgi:hypothetical protein
MASDWCVERDRGVWIVVGWVLVELVEDGAGVSFVVDQ